MTIGIKIAEVLLSSFKKLVNNEVFVVFKFYVLLLKKLINKWHKTMKTQDKLSQFTNVLHSNCRNKGKKQSIRKIEADKNVRVNVQVPIYF